MAKDHYVPRTYLRHFTEAYRQGRKGGDLAVCSLHSFRVRMASINVHLANEENFYNGHPVDRIWQGHESSWPANVKALRDQSLDGNVANAVIEFASIQYGRVPAQMERLARRMAFENRIQVPLPDQPGKFGMMMGMVPTLELMARVEAVQRQRSQMFKSQFMWTCYSSRCVEHLLTSDNPCIFLKEERRVIFPLSFDAFLIGEFFGGVNRQVDLRYKAAKHSLVRNTNRITARFAKDHVYASTKSSELSRFIQKQRKGTDEKEPLLSGRSFGHDAEHATEEEFLKLHAHYKRLRATEDAKGE